MTVQTNLSFSSPARDLLDGLLAAHTEAEVHACLDRRGYTRDEHWAPYGGVENNGGQFLNQQASPRGALVEKVVNSIDAVLMAGAHQRGDLPGSPPASMFAAAERYFGVPGGRLAEITATDRGGLARRSVQVVFSGRKIPGRPTITITDRGEGQAPDDFPRTFTSLAASNKLHIPFVQGKFNMGSTGAVPFCGKEHNYQLIVSRRQPAAPGDSEAWGFTVVRRLRPRADERLSRFQYLAPGGEILRVEADALPVWAAATRGPRRVEWGSLVRLYEYDLPEKSKATLDFARMLNRRLYRTPVPIQVVETRSFKIDREAIVSGLDTRLAVDAADVVEDGFPVEDELTLRDGHVVRVSLIPFKENANTAHWVRASEAVIFTVNGQAHAFEPRDFLRRRGARGVGFQYLARSLLVAVDCSALPAGLVEQLFMGSRDRMRDIDEKRELLEELAGHLRGHEGLRTLNYRRRVTAIRRSAESSEKTDELFRRMIDSSAALAAILRGAGNIPAPVRANGRRGAAFEGRRFPTYLRWRKGGSFLQKHCPANSWCDIQLETDAENAFLSRPVERGECLVAPEDWMRSRKLWDGRLSIRLQPPEGTPAGTVLPLRVGFTWPACLRPLEANGELIVDPPRDVAPNPPGQKPRPRKSSVQPPEIREVRRDGWSGHGFSDRSVARVDSEEGRTIVFVNMDNRSLAGCCYAEPARAEELREMYKLATAAMAVSLERAVQEEEIGQADADQAFEAIGDVLVPAVDFAGRIAYADGS